MKTYFIVEMRDFKNDPSWRAFSKSLLSILGLFSECCDICRSNRSADDCEQKLRLEIESKKFKPVIIRVLKI